MPPPQTEVLITVDGVERGRHVFAPGEYVLGRDADCHIPIEAGLVSRRHAKLTLNFDNALIEDLGSDGGTHINGKPVAGRTRLWPNQKIQVGAATIELRRLKADSDPDRTLAPTQEVVKRVLPEAFLREKKYDIGGVVAQGGMGAILDAKEATIERTVAMKVMLDSNAPDDLLRFLNEAKITGQLEHPNIVPVHELSVDENGQPFYTMKFVKGTTLRKVLEQLAAECGSGVPPENLKTTGGTPVPLSKKFPLPVLLTIFQKVCDALAFAHSRGVIHRDLKPENIMVGDFGEVLLMDWGLAKRLRNTEPQGPEPVEGDIRTIRHTVAEEMPASAVFDPAALASTMAGAIMGTPQYMAPEQARGEIETLDQRADIYALGAILYHILALRPSVTGKDSMEVVGKVARGEIEPLECAGPPALWQERSDAAGDGDPQAHGKPTTAPPPSAKRQRAGALQKGRAPHRPIHASLAAVVRKAMALDPAARYRSVEALQAEILAYQNGFATGAENAGFVKQFSLLVRRHKAAALGIAAVLLVGSVLGAKAILEGRRAEREAVRAKAEATRAEDALADLKGTAPDLLALAASEAALQHYESALNKTDAVLALDPALLPAYWRRGCLLLAQEKLPEAVAALRLAQAKDPANRPFAALLPLVEKIAAAPVEKRHEFDLIKPLYDQLSAVGAIGEATPLIPHLKLGNEARLALVKERLERWLSKPGTDTKAPYSATIYRGDVSVGLNGIRLADLEPLRGLPIVSLHLEGCGVTSLEPLRGMGLQQLDIARNQVEDLSPLEGMPLKKLLLSENPISDLSPLRGMQLTGLTFNKARDLSDISPLAGMPLDYLQLTSSPIADFAPLKGMPLKSLFVTSTGFSDGRVLTGAPLGRLVVSNNRLKDLSTLVGLPLLSLNISKNAVADFTPLLRIPTLESLETHVAIEKLLPLRAHPRLKQIKLGDAPFRPVAEIWAEFDAQQAAGKK